MNMTMDMTYAVFAGWILIALAGSAMVLAIAATWRVVSHCEGKEIPNWLLLVWLVPLIGPILALIYAGKSRSA